MYSSNLRLVVIRNKDQYGNFFYEYVVKTVDFLNGVPFGYRENWEDKYVMSANLKDLTNDLEVKDTHIQYLIGMLEKKKKEAVDRLDEKIAACKEPCLIYPDDFDLELAKLAKEILAEETAIS